MIKVEIGDVVTTKKPHPCGSREWIVSRVGADYKLTCKQCERTVLMSADGLRKSVVAINGEKVVR